RGGLSTRLPHPLLGLLQRRLERLQLLVFQNLAAEALPQVEVDDSSRGLGGGGVAGGGLAAHGEGRRGVRQAGARPPAETAAQTAVGGGGGERRPQSQVEEPGDRDGQQQSGAERPGYVREAPVQGCRARSRAWETGRRPGCLRLLFMVQARPEIVPQLPQAAKDLNLIAQAEGQDVAVPAEEHEVPRL